MNIALTHFIWLECVKNLTTNTLPFNITQFFLFLNYQILSLILEKAGFNLKDSSFFKNYLVGKKTMYFWNNFFSPLYNVDIDISQGFALSPILFTLYFSLIFYILEKWLNNLKISILFCLLLTIDFSFLNTNLFLH